MKNSLIMGTASGWAFMLLLSVAAPTLAQEGTEMGLLELNRQLFEPQLLEQDPTFLRSISDESYVVVAPDGVIESRAQVKPIPRRPDSVRKPDAPAGVAARSAPPHPESPPTARAAPR